MLAQILQVDAFASRLFSGDPAAVTILETLPHDTAPRAPAAESNLADTAFLIAGGGDESRLRWITPKVEVPLRGRATLASAVVVMERIDPGRDWVVALDGSCVFYMEDKVEF